MLDKKLPWIGVLVVALVALFKGGDIVPLPITDTKADKLWVITLDDVATRTPQQTLALDVTQWPNVNYEHYWKPSAEATKFASVSKYADEAIFLNADTGKVLGVVEIPAKPETNWAATQIARFAK